MGTLWPLTISDFNNWSENFSTQSCSPNAPEHSPKSSRVFTKVFPGENRPNLHPKTTFGDLYSYSCSPRTLSETFFLFLSPKTLFRHTCFYSYPPMIFLVTLFLLLFPKHSWGTLAPVPVPQKLLRKNVTVPIPQHFLGTGALVHQTLVSMLAWIKSQDNIMIRRRE